MKIKKGDKVQIMTGKDKGKKGTVVRVFPQKEKLIVEGINIVKRHVKPGAVSKEGGIISIERPINISNVMYLDEKSKKPTRIGFRMEKGKKVRVSKKSNEVI